MNAKYKFEMGAAPIGKYTCFGLGRERLVFLIVKAVFKVNFVRGFGFPSPLKFFLREHMEVFQGTFVIC